METIRIAHLYYDIMNLYGDNGNIRALVKNLEKQDVKVVLSNLTIDDQINFKNFDFFYIGSGTVENTILILEDLKQYSEGILEAIKNKKHFLITGDSLSIFGKTLNNDKEIKCLNIFNFDAFINKERIVGEQFFSTTLIKQEIIGFQNRETYINEVKTPLFNVNQGNGYDNKNNIEGIRRNNFYATYLIGPLLIRNPYFTEYLIKSILKERKIKYTKQEQDTSYKAYEEYLNNFKQKTEE